MAVIVDKTKDKTLTNMHLEMHKKFIHKDKYSEHIHLYGPDFLKVGYSNFLDSLLVLWPEVDWLYEGPYGQQTGRKVKNSKIKQLRKSVGNEGIKLNRTPIAIVRLPEGVTSRGKKYVPVNGRTRRKEFQFYGMTNFIADVYEIDYTFNTSEWLNIYAILSLLFNSQIDDPAGELNELDLTFGAAAAIGVGIKIPVNIDSKNETKKTEAEYELLMSIRAWMDLALGSGKFVEKTRHGYAQAVLENWQIKNGAIPSLMSWTDKEYKEKWKKNNGYIDDEDNVYLDISYDNPTYTWRDVATKINELVKQFGSYEKIPVVNLVASIPLTGIKKNLKSGYEDRRKATKKNLFKRLKSYREALFYGKPARLDKVKLFGVYPAFSDRHNMGHFVLYK